jgi:hypothetical protein
MQWLKPMLLLHNVVGKCEQKNIDYAGYRTFRNLQTRHLNALLSFERLGRLRIKDKIMLLIIKICWVTKEKTSLGSNVTIYRRNLQRAYIERMSYLMKEKSGRPSDYYNVAQSDVRGLVRGLTLKSALSIAKTKVHPETKYHYEDAIKRLI